MAGQLSLFGGPRQRGRAAPTPLEKEIQKQVAETLDRWRTPGWRFTHFPAGEKRDKITAVNLKRAGLKRGWADFVLLKPYPPGVFFLELKREGGTLTAAQRDMRAWCQVNGYAFEVADSYRDAIEILKRWGAVRVSIGV